MPSDDEDGPAPSPDDDSVATDNGTETTSEDEDMRTVYVQLPEWQFDKLSAVKEEHGRTWKGLLIDGYRFNVGERFSKDDE